MNSNLNTKADSRSSDNSSNINGQSAPKTQDSFVKLAMRNMVKKGGTSLFHFSLTIFGVIATLLGLAIAFH